MMRVESGGMMTRTSPQCNLGLDLDIVSFFVESFCLAKIREIVSNQMIINAVACPNFHDIRIVHKAGWVGYKQ